MSKKAAALAAVVVLALTLAVVLALQNDVGRPDDATTEVAKGQRDVAAAPVAPTTAVQRTEAPTAVPASAPITGALLVQVFWQKDEAPAPCVGVAVWPLQGSAARQELLCVSDAAGQCRFDGLPPGDYAVESASRITLTASIVAGQTCQLRLPANHDTTVHGVVVDEFDRPVAGADIWLSEEINWFRGYVVAQSDAAGRFSVPAGNNQYVGARKDGFMASYWRGFHARIGTTEWRRDFEFTLQLRGTAGGVRGQVVDAAGLPVAGARVFVGPQLPQQAPGMRGLNDEYEPRGVAVVTGDDGTFARLDVPPGPTELRAWAVGHGPLVSGVDVQAGALAAVLLQLPASAALQGVVRDGRGEPVAEAALQIGATYDFFGATARSGADGGYRFADLGAGEVKVEVVKAGASDLGGGGSSDLKVETKVVLVAGATTPWDPVLAATRTVRGVVLDPSGQPMRRAHVGLEPWMDGGGRADCRVDDAGRFVFTDVAPDRVQILVVRQGLANVRKVALPPGQDEVTVRIAEEDLPTASLRMRVVDEEGRAKVCRVMWRAPGDNASFGLQQDQTTGVARVESMRPGSYELAIFTDEMTVPLPPLRLAAHENRDLGDVVVPTPAKLHLRVRTAADAPAKSGWIEIVDDSGQCCTFNPPPLRGGELEVAAPPGTWTLLVHGDGAAVATTVTLRAGGTAEVAVTLPRCRAVPVTIEPDAGVFAFGMVNVLVRDPGGALRYSGRVITGRDGSLVSQFDLPPGDYECTALGSDDSRGVVAITVPAEGDVMPLRIPLRATR